MRVLTAAQMRDADAGGMARLGEVALMQAAGERLAAAIARLAAREGPLVAFAGPGNNGGDAFAALALADRSRARILYAMPAPKPSEARRDAERRAADSGVDVRAFPTSESGARAALADAGLALDALLGTGARSVPDPPMHAAIAALNGLPRERVLAVDLPTGVDATTGAAAPQTVRAGATVTLGAPKIGLLLETARPFAGRLYVGDIGLAAEIDALPAPFYAVLTGDEFGRLSPQRAENADKRSAGAPLVVAGSEQFPGRQCCALSARRAPARVTLPSPPPRMRLPRSART